MKPTYYDFQLSKAQGRLIPPVTGLVSIGNICVTHHKSPPNYGMAEFDKLLLETEPVAHGKNVVLTSKLCPQTSFMPYSTDNKL